jgi:ubiquinone/menaquinone biosynthesis C-methylase UbiE
MSNAKAFPEWQWNEIQQVGTDYANLAEVEAYDKRMGSFRDVDAENRGMLEALALPSGARVLEIGCGTGRFARAALAAGLKATAIDVSPIMLDYVAAKAREEGLSEPELQHSGFLTMDFPAGRFDAVVSGAALHHLPDAWKLAGIRNIAKALKAKGQFILRDVVFSLKNGEEPGTCFERMINSFNEKVRPNAIGHVKKEFSTYDWIMEGLLERGGFEILTKNEVGESFIVYHCRKA